MVARIPPGELRVEVSDQEDGEPTVVRVTGEIDLSTAPALRDVLLLALEEGRRVAVDMGGVEFIDASGISVLVEAAARARNGHGRLTIRNPRPMARRIFQIVSLDGALPIEESSAES